MLELVFVKGGWVMVPIMALSIYALAVVFYKFYQFRVSGAFNRAFIAPAMQLMRREAYPEAVAMLAAQKGPIARVMQTAMEVVLNRDIKRHTKEAEIARVGAGELRIMESHMRGLEMVYTAAPLLGLLGTVLGMVSAFAKLAAVGSRVDPSILAGGIWEALITTVGGLCVAVPALMAYYWLDSIIERVRANMRDTATQILALDDYFERDERSNEEEFAQPEHEPETLSRLTPPKQHYAKPARQKPARATAAQTARKNGDSRMSLFSLAAVPETPEPKHQEAAPAAVIEEAPAPAQTSATSTLHLLSPTYTKF